MEGAHLGQEVAAEGAPAGQLRVREQKEPKFWQNLRCVSLQQNTDLCVTLILGQDQRGKIELSDLSGVSG